MIGKAEIPRRDFLIGLGLAGSALTTAAISKAVPELSESLLNPEYSPSRLEQLLSYERVFINPAPEALLGTIVNVPFTPYDGNPNIASKFLGIMDTFQSTKARTFVHDNVEGPIGQYDIYYLDKLRDFIIGMNEASEEPITFTVSLFDTFNLLHSNKFNPIYGSVPLKHAYLRQASNPDEVEKRQKDFFTDASTIDEFKRRLQFIVSYLQPAWEHITCWEIANEPEPKFKTNDKKSVLTEWLYNVLPAITDIDPNTPISAGTKDATDYSGSELVKYGLNTASFHIYGGNFSKEQRGLYRYIKEMIQNTDLPPVLLGETGFPRRFLGVKLSDDLYDSQLARVISDMVINNAYINDEDQQIILPVSNLGIWQPEINDESRDGFHIIPDENPKAVKALQMVQSLYAENSLLE